MATFSDLVASFDADPAKRGKQFEVFVKWFLKTDPEWATQVEQVWLWEEYPDRWGIDCGIDLVFRHKNGEIWSVQAKCYASSYDITKHDVDKFLSESNRKGIDKRLLIATTDRLGANAKQVCDAQEKSVFRYLLSNFESANLDYPAKLADLHTAKRKPKPTPRDHQLEAIDGVVSSFHGTDRGQLIMACGTGKTFTTLWIKERLGATSTLILLPSLGLLSQTLHEWTLAANLPFEVLCVCSDETVGKKGSDEAIHSITDVAFPVTSNVEDIRKFLYRSGAKVVFSTYQSSPLVAEAQGVETVPGFDLAIADEAHRCARKVGNDFTTILDAKLIRARKRLFATATPRTYSTNVKKAASERGIDVIGMDDEAVFGKVSYSLPFGQAIKRGLLTDYQVVIIGVDNPTIAAWIENRELVKTESGIENDAKSLAAQIGLLKAYKDYDLRRVISFHSRVKRAEQFSKDLIDVIGWVGDEHKPSGAMKTDFVSGEMATDKRRIKLARLKSLAPQERGLLTNARCLSEGVDVPSLDGVAFIDPRSSQIDIIQAVGRAIRLSPNKKTGTIVLPVFIEDGDTPIDSIEASNFKPIWDVLNALKAHDDVLSAEMDQFRTEMGRKVGSKVGAFSKIQLDLPSSVDQSFGESLRTHLVEQVTASWEFWYGLLLNYVAELGDCLVPSGHKLADGYALGNWVSNQRRVEEEISPERKARLEGLTGWTWSAVDEQWETAYRHLEEYAAKHGNCMVSPSLKLTNGYELGQWVKRRRADRKKMSSARRARLETLPGWSWAPHMDKWEEGFRYLEEYTIKGGSSLIPNDFTLPNGYRLGQWVSNQRAKRAELFPERRSRLEALIGWSWNPHSEKWETGFQLLAEYSENEGHCLVPSELELPDGYPLGRWLANQRVDRGKLSSERRVRLESLKRWSWTPRSERWEEGYRYLQEYSIREGNCLVPVKFTLPNGFGLGRWVNHQRTNMEMLSADRKKNLEAIFGWAWNAVDEYWETGFRYLQKYVAEHGNCVVSPALKLMDGFKLGQWVARQRVNIDELAPERRTRLESLRGWSWTPHMDKWEEGFHHLEEYSRKHGNCLVPLGFKTPNGYRLGQWVSKQRLKTEKTLLPVRRSRLESLIGWSWNPHSDQWVTGFHHLQRYVVEHGHSRPPSSFITFDGYKLGNWVVNLRARRKKNRLIDDKVKALEEMPGWKWSGR